MRVPLNKRFRGTGSIFLPPARIVYFTDQPENGHFADLWVLAENLDFNQKTAKSNFTDQNMTVCGFSSRSLKYTEREFYISRLGTAIDLKFSPELDIVKTNLLAKFQPNRTSACPVIDYSG